MKTRAAVLRGPHTDWEIAERVRAEREPLVRTNHPMNSSSSETGLRQLAASQAWRSPGPSPTPHSEIRVEPYSPRTSSMEKDGTPLDWSRVVPHVRRGRPARRVWSRACST